MPWNLKPQKSLTAKPIGIAPVVSNGMLRHSFMQIDARQMGSKHSAKNAISHALLKRATKKIIGKYGERTPQNRLQPTLKSTAQYGENGLAERGQRLTLAKSFIWHCGSEQLTAPRYAKNASKERSSPLTIPTIKSLFKFNGCVTFVTPPSTENNNLESWVWVVEFKKVAS